MRQVEEPCHVVVLTGSDDAGFHPNWFPHVTFHQHDARSHRPEFVGVRVLRSGQGDVSRTLSCLDAKTWTEHDPAGCDAVVKQVASPVTGDRWQFSKMRSR